MNWGLDLTEGVKGKNYNNETKKIMESGRIEVVSRSKGFEDT